MSGQGGRGRGGCGGRTSKGSGGGRGSSYSGGTRTMKIGLCEDLEGNVFDFGMTSAADKMQILQEKIAQYIREKWGGYCK